MANAVLLAQTIVDDRPPEIENADRDLEVQIVEYFRWTFLLFFALDRRRSRSREHKRRKIFFDLSLDAKHRPRFI